MDNGPLTMRSILGQRDPESAIILLTVPLLLIVWVYFGKQADFGLFFGGFQGRWPLDFYGTIYEYLTAFILMLLAPLLIVKVVFKKSLRAFGFRIGDFRYGMRFAAVAVPVLLLSAYVGSSDPAIQAEYPLAKSMMTKRTLFLVVECFYIVYYISWEFFFRGFMVFGLEKRFGALSAILIQTIPSVLVHVGKPVSECFGAVVAGLVFGYLAIRTRSILYPVLLHTVVGIGTDAFVTMHFF